MDGIVETASGAAVDSPLLHEFAAFNESKPNLSLSQGQKLAAEIQQIGGSAKAVEIPQGQRYSPFSEVVINNDKPNPDPFVRVFRGITQPEAAVVYNQASYALRSRDEEGNVIVLEAAKPLVQALSENPNYANLRAYYDFMQDQADPKTRQELEYVMGGIEDGVLEGGTIRAELLHQQIWFNGGFADTGVAPYVAASYSSKEALGYARSNGALLVIDLPLFELEPRDGDPEGETSIKAWINPERITAIIPYDSVPVDKADQGQIDQAIEVVSQNANKTIFSPDEVGSKISELYQQRKVADAEQQKVDVEQIREKRVNELGEIFPNLGIEITNLQQEAQDIGTDIYSLATQKALDSIDVQMAQIGYPDFIKYMKSDNRAEYQRKDGQFRPIKWDGLNNDMVNQIKQNADHLRARYGDLKEV